MKRITLKILIAFVLAFITATLIPRLFILLFIDPDNNEVITETSFFIGTILTSALALLLYSIAMNYLIVKRIKSLSIATQEVAKGNYDASIDPIGNDEITSLENNFNLMALELKSNEYLNKAFVRNFSHELKTPISAIKGYAELLDDSTLDPSVKKEYLQIITTEASRLSNLSSSMLQLSLLDSKTVMNKQETFNVTEQIRGILQVTHPVWDQKDLVFNLNLEEITLTNAKNLTHQLWQNLISNAIKFSNEATSIDITLKQDNQNLIFMISNHGPGIKADDLDFIFDLFYTANPSRHQKSSGVGLSIVKKIVETLNGTIKVSSEINGETTFICKLPINH